MPKKPLQQVVRQNKVLRPISSRDLAHDNMAYSAYLGHFLAQAVFDQIRLRHKEVGPTNRALDDPDEGPFENLRIEGRFTRVIEDTLVSFCSTEFLEDDPQSEMSVSFGYVGITKIGTSGTHKRITFSFDRGDMFEEMMASGQLPFYRVDEMGTTGTPGRTVPEYFRKMIELFGRPDGVPILEVGARLKT